MRPRDPTPRNIEAVLIFKIVIESLLTQLEMPVTEPLMHDVLDAIKTQ